MLYSLLLEKKKNNLKAYGVVEEISALRDRDSRWNETQTKLHPFFHPNHTSPPPFA